MEAAGSHWGMAGVLAALLGTAPALGDDAVSAIRIAYGSPGDCPGSAAFTSQVLRRTSRLRLARAGEASVVPMQVTISVGRRGYRGRLELTRSDGRVHDREVDGETCEEVVAALALVTALAFDPHASIEPLAPLPDVAPAPVPGSAPPPAPPPLRTRNRPQEATPPPLGSERWHVAFGVAIGIRTEVTPDPIVVAPVLAGLHFALPEPFALELLASFERSQTDEVADSAALDRSVDESPSPEELSSMKQARLLLDQALGELPIELRAVFVLFELEGLTMAEIADVAALAPGTVASRLRRARGAFREIAARLQARIERGGGNP